MLRERPRLAAEVLTDWAEHTRHDDTSDFFDLLASLGEAAQSGIIVEPTS
jgi:hypothetical protein